MGLGERAKPSNSSVSTTRIRPLSGPHWPWMLLQALSALRSGPRLQHLVQLHIRTDCGPQGHQLKNPSTVVHAQFARLQLSQWDRHRGTQCASVRCSLEKYHTFTVHPRVHPLYVFVRVFVLSPRLQPLSGPAPARKGGGCWEAGSYLHFRASFLHPDFP